MRLKLSELSAHQELGELHFKLKERKGENRRAEINETENKIQQSQEFFEVATPLTNQ